MMPVFVFVYKFLSLKTVVKMCEIGLCLRLTNYLGNLSAGDGMVFGKLCYLNVQCIPFV